MEQLVKDRWFCLAEKYVEETGVSVFLTGKAGTGKTTFLRYIAEHTRKRAVVLAPTGVAAVNARGTTIHSFFSLPLCPYLPDVPELRTEYQMPERYRRLRKDKVKMIRLLELLIIDEVSMVRADLLDAVDMTLRRCRRSDRPFGGVQLLMIGDAQQLSPVVTEAERPFLERVYPSPYFFHSQALARLDYVTLELQSIYRQADAGFVEILNGVRDNCLTPTMLQRLNARVGAPAGEDWIRLTTHNAQADEINRTRMEALPGRGHTLTAEVEGDYPESLFPASAEWELKAGARVMFLRNDPEGAYYNGKIATVLSVGEDTVTVVDDEGTEIPVSRLSWENLQYTLDEATGEIRQEIKGTFSQFPLRPAWAITIHKSQGLTFDHVIIDAGAAFAYGQVYVALSRCRSLEGISLARPIRPSLLMSEPDVSAFNASFPDPDAVGAALPKWREQYDRDLLLSCFRFEDLRRMVFSLRKIWRENLSSLYPMQLGMLEKAASQVEEMEEVAGRFRTQLTRVYPDADLRAERVAKACAFFLPVVEGLPLRSLFMLEIDNTQVRKQISQLGTDLLPQWRVHLDTLSDVSERGFDPLRYRQLRSAALAGEDTPAKKKAGRAGRKKEKAVAEPVQEVDVRDVYKDNRHPELVAALIAWRREKAREAGLPAFTVMHQKTLMLIADAAPSTRDGLLSIHGFGLRLWERYGEEILDLLYKQTSAS